MKRIIIATAALLVSLAGAQASIVITVDKTAQRLSVAVDGAARYQWPVSTARWGYRTPNGTYRPQRLERKWFSREYDNSPMPYSIFFHNGYAIHGSYEISHLGRPASHGCIRLHPEQAAILFKLVKGNVRDTQIVITGDRPARGSPAVASRASDVQPVQPAQAPPAPQGFQNGFGAPGYNGGFDNGAIPYRPPGL
jgi:L,D-transpeptidase catalytic domain